LVPHGAEQLGRTLKVCAQCREPTEFKADSSENIAQRPSLRRRSVCKTSQLTLQRVGRSGMNTVTFAKGTEGGASTWRIKTALADRQYRTVQRWLLCLTPACALIPMRPLRSHGRHCVQDRWRMREGWVVSSMSKGSRAAFRAEPWARVHPVPDWSENPIGIPDEDRRYHHNSGQRPDAKLGVRQSHHGPAWPVWLGRGHAGVEDPCGCWDNRGP
jgi:hypothetical protein